jgi:hypothetical protein
MTRHLGLVRPDSGKRGRHVRRQVHHKRNDPDWKPEQGRERERQINGGRILVVRLLRLPKASHSPAAYGSSLTRYLSWRFRTLRLDLRKIPLQVLY